jgi:hypothetical protein
MTSRSSAVAVPSSFRRRLFGALPVVALLALLAVPGPAALAARDSSAGLVDQGVTTPITVGGSAVTATVQAPASQARLRFSVTKSVTVVAAFSSWTFPSDGATSVYLANTSGQLITSLGSLNGSGPWSAAPERLGPGSYYVVIDSGPSGDSGSVTVQLARVGAISTDGRAVAVSIGKAEQPVLLAFTAPAGSTVSAGASASTFGAYAGATIGVENSAGVVQGLTAYVGASTGPVYSVATLAKAGTYYVALTPAGAGSVGTARLSLHVAPAPAAAKIGGPAVTVATSTPGAPATATFTGTAGESVGLVVHSTTFSGYTARVYVAGKDGVAVGPEQYLSASATADGPVILPLAGRYTVIIDPGLTWSAGRVRFSLIKITDVRLDGKIGGAPVTAAIAQPTQRAFVTFTAKAGEKVLVRYSANTFTAPTDTIALDGPGSAVIDAPVTLAGTSGYLQPAAAPKAGTYTVVIDPSFNGDTGQVSVSISKITDITGSITPGVPVSVQITTPGQRAFYRFTTSSAGESASFEVTGSTFTSSDSLYVIDGTGATVGSTFPATNGDQGPVSLSGPGAYQVVIDPTTGSNDTGSLTLTMTLTSPAGAAPRQPAAQSPPPPLSSPPASGRAAGHRAGSAASNGPTFTISYDYSSTGVFFDGGPWPGGQGYDDTGTSTATWTQAPDGNVTGSASVSGTGRNWLYDDVCIIADTGNSSSSGHYSGALPANELTTSPQPDGSTAYAIYPAPITASGTQSSQSRDYDGGPCPSGESSSSDPWQSTVALGAIQGSIPAGQASVSGHSACGSGVSVGSIIGFAYGITNCSLTWTISDIPCAPPYKPSGPDWTKEFPQSNQVKDLSGKFREDVTSFIGAMRTAGVTVKVISTLRPPERAYLMHYSWLIASTRPAPDGKLDPRDVPAFVPSQGQSEVDICWVHANGSGIDLPASVTAAKQMVSAFGIDPKLKDPPALSTLHTQGLAIDMTTTWSSNTITIVNSKGKEVTIASGPHSGLNKTLIAVGASYGVIHLKNAAKDPNHWSVNGH